MSTAADRFAGPLATGWPQLGHGEATANLLARPEVCLPVAPASDRGTWGPGNPDEPTIRAIRRRAAADVGAPWPTVLARDYVRYFRDCDRNTYEQMVFARQQRLSRAAVLAAVTLDPVRLDEVADGVTLLCEQSTWCWPAHDDTRRAHGAVVPTVTDPFLDLGAGEVAAQLAWLDHLLGRELDERWPGLRARIRHEVDRRVLTPFATRRDWHWLGLRGDVHNWSPWIQGNVLVAALRLVDDLERRARLVDLVVEGLDRYAASLPPDGAIDEGYSYWWNGACRLLEALDLLTYATRGALGEVVTGGLRETVAFPCRVHLGGGWYLNHADGPARPSPYQAWDALHRTARRVGDRDAEAHAAAQRRPGAPVAHENHGLGRLLLALTDPAWRTAAPAVPPLPRDAWFASTQVLLARTTPGSSAGLTLAVKGGHNGEHHNHNDVGSVVVAVGGVPVLVDAGRPTYTAQTFGPDRYGIWTMQSSWHNVPEIRGVAQAPGRRHAAREVTVSMDEAQSAMTLDLAAAYPRAGVRHWWRTARLDRVTGEVVVRDSWELDAAGEDAAGEDSAGEDSAGEDSAGGGAAGEETQTSVRLLVAGRVRVGPGHAEITALEDAGTVVLNWTPADLPCATTVRELDDPMLSDVWGDRLTRLDIDVSALGPVGVLEWSVRPHR